MLPSDLICRNTDNTCNYFKAENRYCKRDFITEDNYLCEDTAVSNNLCRENFNYSCRDL